MTTMPAPPNLLLDGVESELREVAAQAYAMHAPELDQILTSMRGVEAHFERVCEEEAGRAEALRERMALAHKEMARTMLAMEHAAKRHPFEPSPGEEIQGSA